VFILLTCIHKFHYIHASMEVFKHLLAVTSISQSKEIAIAPSSAGAASASTSTSTSTSVCDASQELQSQFKAQTARLQQIHKEQRPKNTVRSYDPKQKERDRQAIRMMRG